MREGVFGTPEAYSAGLQSAGNLESAKGRLEAGVIAGLVKYGVLTYEAGHPLFDVEKLKEWSSRNEIYAVGKKITQIDMIRVLASMQGVARQETENASGEQALERPAMVIPKSVEDLLAAGESGYAERNKTALLEPWELGQKHKSWTTAFVLGSGEETSLAEMAIASTLHKWQAERGSDGRLTVIHPVSGQRVPFSASLVHEFAGIKPQLMEDKKLLSFDGNPLKFATKYLPHLMEAGLFKQSDFRTMGGSRTAEEFNVHERRLNPKVANVSFSNSDGQFASYYIGRQKLVGTDIEIHPENMSARLLDKQTAAIIKDEQGRKTIVATFPLLEPEQLTPIRESVKRRLIERGQQPIGRNIAANTVIGGRQMKDRVREYSITDYLKPRSGENPAEYYKRLRPLDDPEFVLKKTNEFFQQAGIGLHNLPWSEQLLLSRTLLEKNNESELLSFGRKYGLEGVRSFLSLDYDRKLGPKILAIGENLEGNIVREIFRKYAEIVDAANQAQRFVEEVFPGSSPDSAELAKIKEQLLKKGKDLLVQMSANQSSARQLQSVYVLEQLEAVKTDILLFAAMFKNFAGEKQLSLAEFPGVSLEEKDSSALTADEKEKMLKIFLANRLGNYPDRLREHTLADFGNNLKQPGHIFRILRHGRELVAFFHYDKVDSDTFYVGSLNLHPSAKDSPIAVAMLKEALREKADKKLTAVVWASNPARLFYTKFLGFKKIGEIADYQGTGETYWQLERPKQKAEALQAAA